MTMNNAITTRIEPLARRSVPGIGFAALMISIAAFCATAQAQIYKWVDANGVTHYTQYPPQDTGIATREIDVVLQQPEQAASAQAALQQRVDSLDQRRSDKKLAAEQGEEAVAHRKQVQQFCEASKARLAEFESGRRLAEKQEDGSYLPVSEERRKQQIASMKTRIAENCQ